MDHHEGQPMDLQQPLFQTLLMEVSGKRFRELFMKHSQLTKMCFLDCVNIRTPIYIDGWMSSQAYACLLCESPFTLDSTWKTIWDQEIVLIVTLITTAAKVVFFSL